MPLKATGQHDSVAHICLVLLMLLWVAAADWGLDPDVPTVADYLQEIDYATHLLGKWHLYAPTPLASCHAIPYLAIIMQPLL